MLPEIVPSSASVVRRAFVKIQFEVAPFSCPEPANLFI
jgi:hypothetical protein